MVPESKSGDCFGCCSLLFPAPVRLLSTLEAIKEGINSTFVLVEQIQRYSCVKTFCFHIARIYGCTQCCCTSCRDCCKKGPRMGWFKPQFVSSDRGTCLAWLAARIRGMSDFRELSLVSTHSHPPQGSSTHPFLLVPLPSQRKGVKARMVKEAAESLKHSRVAFGGFVVLAKDWIEKWLLFLIFAPNNLRTRGTTFSCPQKSSIFLPQDKRKFLFFQERICYLCYVLHPGKSISLKNVVTILREPFTGNQSQAQLAERVTRALLDKIKREGDNCRTMPVCGEFASGTTEFGWKTVYSEKSILLIFENKIKWYKQCSCNGTKSFWFAIRVPKPEPT